MNFTGLSLEQAPPIQSVLRFFLTAPLFALAASTTLFFVGSDELLALVTPKIIALVHLFTLGFMMMIIFGALQQMLPVIAGVSLPSAARLSLVVYTTLLLGIVGFFAGFYFEIKPFLHLASLMLFISFITLFSSVLYSLQKVIANTSTIIGMKIASTFALITAFLGVIVMIPHIGGTAYIPAVIHIIVAIFGIAVMLIVALSFKIIPMFYVAQRFKPFCKHYVLPILTLSLILWAVSEYYLPQVTVYFKFTYMLFSLAFSLAVFRKMKNRKRPIVDVTIYFWYTAAVFLGIGTIVWMVDTFSDSFSIYHKSLFIFAFIMSVFNAMIYKIVPFIVWFHLNAKGYFSILTMRELLHEQMNYTQYGMFLLGLVSLFFLPLFSWIIYVVASLWSISFFLLAMELFMVYAYYKKVLKGKPDFEMS